MKRHLSLLELVVILAFVVACGPTPSPTQSPKAAPVRTTLRLFLVDSYTADDFWSQQVRIGILETLGRAGYTTVEGTLEMETFYMDVRHVAVIEEARPAALRAIERLVDFQPDIVIMSGEESTRSIIPLYFDPTLPFVFCGFVGEPSSYGLNLPNVTGVVEVLRPVQTVAMAYAFVEDAQRYLLLSDGSVSGTARALSSYLVLGQSEYGVSTFSYKTVREWSDWRKTVLAAGKEADFILLAGYQGIVDDTGRLLDEKEVMAWMFAYSPIPVFALTNHAVVNGAVGGLVSYGYEEGVSVGNVVLRLAEGESPANIPIRGPERNLLAVNLMATRRWNLRIPITFPIAARIYGIQPAAQGGQ